MAHENEQQEIEEVDGQVQHVKGVIESLLFVNEKPVTLEQIKKVLDTVSNSDLKQAIASLQNEYEERKSGVMILEIAGGYQMLSNPIYALYLRNFYQTKHKEKLSKPALESMAIIAYRQPVTRSNIELIRGVNSDGVVAHLQNKELIKVVGRKDVPGRPYVYGTTKQFLEYFGLKSLDDLPKLEEFPDLQPADESSIIELSEDDKKEQSESAQPAEVQSEDSESSEEEVKDVDDEEAKESSQDADDEQREESGETQEANRLSDEDFQDEGQSDNTRVSAEVIEEQVQEEYQDNQEEWNQENGSKKIT